MTKFIVRQVRARWYVRLLVCGILAAFVAHAARADERTAALVNSFQVMCTLSQPNFTQLDAKAQAMKLPVRQDLRKPPDAYGNFLHSKSWLLPLKTGPHELVGAEGRGPNGNVASCGIGAPDANGKEFKRDLVKAMGLGKASNEGTIAGGKMRATKWQIKLGASTATLLLADGTPTGSRGIYLTLTQVSPVSR